MNNTNPTYPLTVMQEGMLFHSLYTPESGVYLMQMICNLHEPLDQERLAQAWRVVVEQYAMLRVSYILGPDQPVSQQVHPKAAIHFARFDLREKTVSEQQAEWNNWLAQDRATPFDFSTAPLMRFALFCFSNDNFRLVWTFHHSILDGRSFTRVLQDVFSIYDGKQRPSDLPPDQAQRYLDWYARQNWESEHTYWEARLQDFQTPTPIPAKLAAGKSGPAQTRKVHIAPEIVSQLQQAAKRHNLTLNTFVMGAWGILLARYANQNDILFGATRAGRHAPGLENDALASVVGLTINTLPIRMNADPSQNLLAWLQTLRADWLALREGLREHTPLSKIQEWCTAHPAGGLFESVLIYENYLVQDYLRRQGPTWQARSFDLHERTNYPLTLTVYETDGLLLKLHYDTGLIDEILTQGLLEQLRAILHSFCNLNTRNDLKIADVRWLSEKEQNRIIRDWNAASLPLPEDACIHTLFERQVQKTPLAEALIFQATSITYQEINQRANQLAHHLRQAGVQPDELVGVCLERSPKIVIALLGILKAGAAYVPLDPAHPRDRLSAIVQDSRMKRVISEPGLNGIVPTQPGLEIIYLDSGLDGQPNHNPENQTTPSNLAYVLFTSGTTGRPKGVALEHRNAAALIHWTRHTFSEKELGGMLASTSIGFDLSVFEIFGTLCNGGRIILVENILSLVTSEINGLTFINTVPSAIAELVRLKKIPTSVETIILAGEALSNQTVDELYKLPHIQCVIDAYGPTENTTYATAGKRQTGLRASIGKPLQHWTIYILNSNGQPVPSGVPGELWIGGLGVARGYQYRPDLTAERFIPDPFSAQPGARMYRSGDLARWLPDGNLEYMGRFDHQVKLRGFRIELGEIESALLQHPAVREAVVVKREETTTYLAAYLVADDSPGLENELRHALKTRLPEYMLPAAYVFLPRFPLNTNGKLDRKALPAPQAINITEGNYVAPRSAMESLLVEIWQEVLGKPSVGVHDNFFDLGGHSLLVTRAASRLGALRRSKIPLRAFFEQPTVAEMAAWLGQDETEADLHTPILPTARDQSLALSFAQQRLWFLNELEGSSATYNIPTAYRLRGKMDTKQLEGAFQTLIARHEILRTRFLSQDGQPRLFIAEKVDWRLEIHPASPALDAELTQAASQPFELDRAPLLRAHLWPNGEDESVLLINIHHIISDGWSQSIFEQELGAAYRNEALPTLTLQYVDYAAWQKQHLRGEILARQVNYWKQALAGAPDRLELPTDHPRPARQTYRGQVLHIETKPHLTEKLRELARAHQSTLFMVLYAAFAILLQKYSRQDEIVIGTPVANRQHPEVETMPGFFVNTLALRADLAGNPSFFEFLERVRRMALEAFTHQDLPFEKLVEELHPARHLGYSPIFQVMFTLQNTPQTGLNLPGIESNRLPIQTHTAQFDLSLTIDGDMQTLEYNTDLFESASMAAFAESYVTLLESVLENPNLPVAALSAVSAGQKNRLIGSEPCHEPGKDIISRLEEAARRYPAHPALVFGQQTWSYTELHQQADGWAALFAKQNLGTEARIGLCLERSPEMLAAMLGALKAGCAYVPLDPAYPQERLEFIARDAGLAVVVTRPVWASLFNGICPLLWADQALPAANRAAGSGIQPAAESLAYIIYTSGTTGRPKGVGIPRRALANFAEAAIAQYELTSNDRVLQFASLNFDAAVEEIYPILSCGGTLLLRTDEMLSTAQTFLETCRRWSITVLDLPTAFWQYLAGERAASWPPSLRLVIIGGEEVQAESVAAWQAAHPDGPLLVNTYGPTETTVVAAWSGTEPQTIGTPVPGVTAYILDSHQQLLPPGAPGELCLGGAQVARGYLNRPDLTAEKFIPNPFFPANGETIYRTGDLARWLPDGNLAYLGRLDQQVKLRGFRIELGEIETALLQHPAVHEAAVILREDTPEQKYLAAYLVAEPTPNLEKELRLHLKTRLPEYMLPGAFVFLERLPLTPNGKLDRASLPTPSRQPAPAEPDEPELPATATEEKLRQIWRNVIGERRTIRIQDDFFDVGGHSLAAIQVTARIRQIFGVVLPLQVFFEMPRLSEMAAWIDQQTGEAFQRVSRIPRSGPLPLSFSQQRIWFLNELEGPGATYNMTSAYRLHGNLDIPRLETAFRALITRHEALRTGFQSADGQPEQRITENPAWQLEFHPSGENLAAALASAASQPFDLSRPPLMRAHVWKISGNESVLLVIIHHIIADGWSVGLMERELEQGYGGLSSAIAETFIQYVDYAAWQQTWLQGPTLQKQLDFWKNSLAGAPPLLELPTDRPRPARQTYHGNALSFELSHQTASKMEQLARSRQSTLFMALYTAFAVLLSRYSHQPDLVIGTPVANRPRAELEEIVGFFANTLALRANLAGDPGFDRLLQQTRQFLLDAFSHQELPFEKLVDELRPERSLGYSPIFQVMFAYQDTPSPLLTLNGVSASPLTVGTQTAKFDLSLSMEKRTDGCLAGTFEYNTDLFDGTTIQRMAGHFETLLAGVIANPSQSISSLPLLTQPERQQIETEWSNSHTNYPQNETIQQLFEEQVKRTPDNTAVTFEGQSLTYRQLNEKSNQLAHSLITAGVRPDVLVGICMERSIEMIIGLLGILKAGGAYVPLDPRQPADRLSAIAQDARLSLILSQPSLNEIVSRLNLVRVIHPGSQPGDSPSTNPINRASAQNLAYALFTSGTTGRPKGVALQHANATAFIHWTQRTFSTQELGCVLASTSIGFDLSVFEIFGTLCHGGQVLLVENILRLLNDFPYQPSLVNTVPSAITEILRQNKIPASTQTVVLAGEALPTPIVDQLYQLPHIQRVVDAYGPTENTTYSTFSERKPVEKATIGKPLSGWTVYILDSLHQPVPVGIPGEIHIGGIGLARGYLNRPNLTAERFIPNPFSEEPGARMYRTGDLARWLPHGNIEYLGRIDHQVKIRGFRIELGEIEAALHQHPAVHECVVLAREDNLQEAASKRLTAYMFSDQPLQPDDLREHLKTKLPEYMIPSAFVFLDAFPLTPNGKLDRKALPPPDRQLARETLTLPQTPLQEKIAAAWQKALGNSPIGIDDNFFASGGDSLKVVQVAHHLGYACSVMDIFEHQTIRELAEFIAARQKTGEAHPTRLLYELTPPSPQQPTLSLICFPPAGGNAIVYKDLADQLPAIYSLYAVEMPGHDIHRPAETLLSWPELAARCVGEIKATVRGPIRLYGHSAGASLALETARLLEQENLPLQDIYLGANFPNLRVATGIFRKINLERLVSDRVYEDAQRQVVGSLFDQFDPQARAVRTRSWRHDGLENTEYYTFAAERWQGQKLRAPIVSVVGEKDRGTEFYAEQVHDWRAFGDNLSLVVIPQAGHYFMKHQSGDLAKILTAAPPAPIPQAAPQQVGLARFLAVASGQFVSTIGTIMSSFALGAWVYKTTGSVTNLGSVAFFEVLPLILLLPIAGAVADRWDRRKILLACDGMAILNTLLLGLLLLSGSLQIWHLWGFSAVYAAISAFQQPAYLAGVAQLVPKKYLGQASGFVQLGQAMGNMLAPLVGGALIEALSLQGVVALDLATYFFSFTCLALTRFPNTLFKKEEEPMLRAIAGGWKYLFRRRGLLALAVYFAGNNVGNSVLSVLLIPFVLSFASGNWLGLALASLGLGMAVGSVVIILWGGLSRRVYGILSGFAIMNAFTLLCGLATSPLWLCLGLFGNGLCFSLAAGHFYPLLQVKVGEELLGRILSIFRVISHSSIPIAYLLTGLLADHVFTPLTQPGGWTFQVLGPGLGSGPGRGMGLMLIVVGGLIMLWSLLVSLYHPLRNLELDLPDALLPAVITDDKNILQQEADRQL